MCGSDDESADESAQGSNAVTPDPRKKSAGYRSIVKLYKRDYHTFLPL